MQTLYLLFLGIFLSMQMAACSVNRRESLQSTVDNYVKALRRGDEEGILNYVQANKSTEFYQAVQKLRQFQFSSIEAKTIFPDENFDSALVTVFLEYYTQSGQSVVQARRYLKFNFDQKAEGWFLDETTPLGRTELSSK